MAKKTFRSISNIIIVKKGGYSAEEHLIGFPPKDVLVDINRNRIKVKVEGGEKIIIPPKYHIIRHLILDRELVFELKGDDENGYDDYDDFVRFFRD